MQRIVDDYLEEEVHVGNPGKHLKQELEYERDEVAIVFGSGDGIAFELEQVRVIIMPVPWNIPGVYVGGINAVFI